MNSSYLISFPVGSKCDLSLLSQDATINNNDRNVDVVVVDNNYLSCLIVTNMSLGISKKA